MDCLFQRYSNPFPLLNGMISTGRLCEFIDEFVKIRNEEEEYKVSWEFWLHKVFDKSYIEWKEAIKPTEESENAAPTQTEMEETIRASFAMLEGFSLRGGVDGAIQDTGFNSD